MCSIRHHDAVACQQATNAWNYTRAGFEIITRRVWGLSFHAGAHIGLAIILLAVMFLIISFIDPMILSKAAISIAGWPTPFERGHNYFRSIAKKLRTIFVVFVRVRNFLHAIIVLIFLISIYILHVVTGRICHDDFGCIPLASSEHWAAMVLGGGILIGIMLFISLLMYSQIVNALPKILENASCFIMWLNRNRKINTTGRVISGAVLLIGISLAVLDGVLQR